MVSEELAKRIITSFLLLIVLFSCLFAGGTLWVFLMVTIAMLMLLEWKGLADDEHPVLFISGIFYIGAAVACAVMLRLMPNGIENILFLITCVASADIGAYAGGKRYGRHKLAPTISPGKTWEGFGFGILSASLTGMALSALDGYPHTSWDGLFLGFTLAFIAQAGDLLESAMKRRAGVKDSGSLLPGHGGLLDRCDSHLPAFILFFMIINSYQSF